ncbi:MAG: ABC transporter permease [Actinomycetota bacterium]
MIRIELVKQIRRLRTWLAWGALGGIPTLIAIAQRINPEPAEEGESVYQLSALSGLNHALAALAFMTPFFLVVVVSLFAGESVAGEANWGTLRYLLVRPVRRTRLLAAKFATVMALSGIATIVIVAAAALSGSLAFGWGPIELPFGITIPLGESLAKLALSTLYVIWSLSGVIAFGFMLSTMTDVAGGAAGGAIGLAVGSQILDGISAMGDVRYFLPTHYWSRWTTLFFEWTSTAEMGRGALLQLGYVLLFGAFARWWFTRKDILS